MSSSLFARTALAAAVAIVAMAPAMAQNTTAAIGGRVLTPDGKPVAGATVVVLHRESGSTTTLTTDADGRYASRGLRVGGPYTITVTKGGEKSVNEEVYLALAETTLVDLRLGAAQTQLEQVVVTGSAAGNKFGASNTGAGTSISRTELDSYASLNGNLQDFARLDPRVAQTDKERGEMSVGGQNSRYNSITIDGVKINDTFGLESNNLPTRKQPIPLEALQSVQVNVSNYDVTQQGYTGGNVNAVTKSGTNDFKGTLKVAYRDDAMVGKRFNRTNQTYFDFLPFQEETFGATLGGPLIKDTLFFFASYEELSSNRVQPEFGPVGSELTNVAISPKLIADASALAQSKYGMAIGDTNVQADLSVKDALVKLDWNISERHRANARFARTEQSDTNNGGFGGGFNATSLALSSNIWQQEKTIDTAVAQWFADWTDNFSTEFKVSNRDYHSEPRNAANLPSVGFRLTGPAPIGAPAGVNTGTRFLNFGTERSRHFNILDTQTVDAYFGATLFAGDHEMKFGGDYADNKVFNAFFQDTKGNYTFGCQDGWVYNTIPGVAPGTRLPTSGSANRCSSFSAAQMEAAVLENFSLGRPSAYQVQAPTGSYSLNDGIAQFKIQNMGVFLQDTWTVSNKLTLTAGVRYDRLGLPDRPQGNAAAGAAPVAGSFGTTNASVVRSTGGFGLDNTQVPDGADLFQPRFSFNYALDPVQKRKSQVRGGFGLFQGAAANVWISNAYSNTGVFTRFVGCGNAGQRNCSDVTDTGVFNPDPTKQVVLSGTTPASNVDYLAKDLAQPSVWKVNLGYDRELPQGFVVGMEWLYTGVKDGIYYKHLNLGAATAKGPDGRDMFYTPGAYAPSCWTGNGSLSTSGACSGNRSRALSNASFAQVLMAERTGKGGGNTVTVSVGQPRLGDFSWQMAYSRASATEVSPLTSSVSNSNFNGRSIFNPNEEVAANSAYLVQDRFSGNVRWSKALIGGLKTTVGLVYEGRKGKPYSWTYGNDMNGDGNSGNDLMYVPKDANDVIIKSGQTTGSSAITDAAAAAAFWQVVDANPQLRDSKGGVVARNGSFSKFTNSFDLRFTQEVPAFGHGHKAEFNFDLLNFGNLINRRWGRIDEIGFQSSGSQRRSFANFGGIDPATGKYVYYVTGVTSVTDFVTRQAAGESQWAMQVTFRYSF